MNRSITNRDHEFIVQIMMISKLVTFLVVLFVVILVVGFVLKLVRWAIGLAFIVGIAALILHFVKKKS